jgi:hypothetical protein
MREKEDIVLTNSVHAATATIIPFPRSPAGDLDTTALIKRAWQAIEALVCAVPLTSQAEQAKHRDDLASFVGELEDLALTAERTFARRRQ